MDAVGERFTFDKPVSKVYGGKGFADVWFRDHFAWEYKGKHKDLKAAYKQLNDYREDLGNPPLLVVCDLDRFEVHTNFTATAKRVYAFNLDDLLRNEVTATCPLPPLDVLRALFGDYSVLRPERTDARVTQEAAKVFARLAERLEIEKRAHTAAPIHTKEEIAHFLMRLLFCLFADSIGLLPDHIFRSLVQSDDRFRPKKFLRKLRDLFEAMSAEDSTFGIHSIKYFNGGLFDSDSVIDLDVADLGILYEVSKNYNWAHIAPEIFGTLFERSLNKERRSLIGAHYTSAEDILLLIEPVLMQPLQRRWAKVRDSVLVALEAEKAGSESGSGSQPRLRTTERESERLLSAWIDELTAVKVLDPACGSGNFLYLALRRMLDLWNEAHDFAVAHDLRLAANYAIDHMVSPTQLYGIEVEFYAHELASIVVWIGYLQWKHEHVFTEDREPILQKLRNIEHGDAILRYDAEGKPYEPEWPNSDYIVGNPPFLGGKSLRRELGDHYVDDLFQIYAQRVRAESDLVVYWFEKARFALASRNASRVGLLSTQAIRQGANRNVLTRICESGSIFMAWSDRPWLLNGAAVRISMVGFDEGTERTIRLDGQNVARIFPNLTAGLDLTGIRRLRENDDLAFQGPVKVGAFEIDRELADEMLRAVNVNGRPNTDVIKPWFNGGDITERYKGRFIIDFGKLGIALAAQYEAPFEYLKANVYPSRAKNRDRQRRESWWLLGRSGGNLKEAASSLCRVIGTSRVSKHRFFVWLPPEAVPDTRVVAIARDDDYFFGVLGSKPHVVWARMTSSRHGDGNEGGRPTYNPSVCFDTYPFPWSPGSEPAEDAHPRVKAIAEAARDLVRLREAWLNPPGLREADLKERTLTNLYNQRPAWLENAHWSLDKAVFAAYGWVEDPGELAEQEILARLLALNHERAAAQPPNAKKTARSRKLMRR